MRNASFYIDFPATQTVKNRQNQCYFSMLSTLTCTHFIDLSAQHPNALENCPLAPFATWQHRPAPKLSPRSASFMSENSQKSQEARSGTNGGCSKISIRDSCGKSCTTLALWASTLSWWRVKPSANCGNPAIFENKWFVMFQDNIQLAIDCLAFEPWMAQKCRCCTKRWRMSLFPQMAGPETCERKWFEVLPLYRLVLCERVEVGARIYPLW